MDGERWRPVVGYEGRYEVSNLGRVRSLLRASIKVRKPNLRKGGYLYVRLSGKSGGKWKPVSHLVLEAFVGDRPDGTESCHFPNGPSDNSLANLRWGTKLDNHNDRRIAGTIPVGESHGLAKLTEEWVREIRVKHANGQSARSLAFEYNVSKFAIAQVVHLKTWKHVT